MKTSVKHLFFAALLGVVLLPASRSYGIPAFARKYQMECTMCHEPVPRLNEFGYKFRNAGFRLPEEIGKGEASGDYSNYIAARVVFAGTDKSTVGSDNNSSRDQSGQSNIGFSSASIYPLCGAFGGHVSAWSEFGYSPAAVNGNYNGPFIGTINIGNAFMRLTYGDTSSFWSVRFGLFSAIEGYGASDASISPSSPLMKSAAMTWVGSKLTSSLYTPGTGETGIHFAWDMGALSLQAGIFNGGYAYYPVGSNGKTDYTQNPSFQAAIGGNANKVTNSPSYNSKDMMVFASYVLDEHGGGVQGYLFKGSLDFANPMITPSANPASMFTDDYMRYGLYATSPTFSGFKLLAGVAMGSDKDWAIDTTLALKGKVADSTSSSMGWFVEPNYRFDKNWYVGARYDFFDPFTKGAAAYANQYQVTAKTVFVNYCMNNGLTFYAEVQDKTTLQGMDGTATPVVMKKDDYSLTLRTFFIW